jgi:glycosyltransferase 2 family protein
VSNKWWKIPLQYGIGLALLSYVIWSNWEPDSGSDGVGLKDLANPEREIRWPLYGLAGLLTGLSVSLTFVRWYMLVRAQDLPFTLKDAFRLGLVGYFFNTFLPGAVGGDLIKAAFIAREQDKRTVAVSTVLIDRGVGLWGLIALAAVAGGAFWLFDDSILRDQPDLSAAVLTANCLMAASLLTWVLLGALPERRAQRFAQRLNWIPKIGPVLAEFWRAVWLYRRRGFTVLAGVLISMVNHSINVFIFYLTVRAFQAEGAHQSPGLLTHFIIVPVGLAFQGFFPAPGGVGGGEFVFKLIYKRLGYPAANGIMGCFFQRVLTWIVGFAGYILYLFMKKNLRISAPDPKPEAVT